MMNETLAKVKQEQEERLRTLEAELALVNETIANTAIKLADLRLDRDELQAAIRELTQRKPRKVSTA